MQDHVYRKTQVGTITETFKTFFKNAHALYSHGPQKQNDIMFWFKEINAAQKFWSRFVY